MATTVSAPTTATTAPARPRRQAALPSIADRIARGRDARAVSPRSAHAAWTPPADRRSAVGILEDQATSRVAELIPIRYGRMVASPFTFYRGGAAIMAADIAEAPRTGLQVQLCGDAHLSNFGAFAAPDRRLVFSINDFDETLPGPFEWDLKRFVASMAVAGRSQGFSESKRLAIELAAVRSYREAMQAFAGMSSLDIWYARLDADMMIAQYATEAGPKEIRNFRKATSKAESKTGLKAMAKLTQVVDGRPQFINDPPIVVRLEQLVGVEETSRMMDQAGKLLRSYTSTLAEDRRALVARFRFADIARKVVGVGSVGTRAWVVLMLGSDAADPLVLQVKEAQASVLEAYLGASRYGHHGRRVVEGQRLMQSASDILLGWQRTSGLDGITRDFFVRQLWDKKGSAVIEQMSSRGMRIYGTFCGWTLARAHARSGDPVAIAAYMGSSDTFDKALAAFAESYADQNEQDHAALAAAISAGEVMAQLNV